MNPSELPLEHQILTDRDIAIKLVGVGGAGANAVDRLKMENLERLQMAVVNTDLQALNTSPVQDKVLIGSAVTRGLGAGGDPDLGREAAEADREKIAEVIGACDIVFLVAGMGGGTGSGAAPVVADVAAEQGALVVAFVTLPFSFEGGRRLKQAEEGLVALRRVCDAVIVLPNEVLLQESAESETVLDSFARADEWIGRGVKSIWAMLFRTGIINLDFATLRCAFATARGGRTLFGLGNGSGEDAISHAIESLRMCPLLATPEASRRADRLLVNIIGGTSLTLARVNELMTAATDQFGREAHVIMGAVIDEEMQDRVEICILGTCDMGSRAATRRPLAAPRSKLPGEAASPVSALPPPVPASAARGTVHQAKHAGNGKPVAQDEFTFGEIESRGYFDKTDRNLFEGQDLDVPTYLRKGIKVAL
jgi:cell division protein FtsZ